MPHTSSLASLFLCLSLVIWQALAPQAFAGDKSKTRTISLTGTGIVKTAPDMVEISTGVTSEAPSARAALDKNTESMTGMVAALKDEGIEAKDIQTANFSVGPIYRREKDGKAPVIVGYRVTNQVRIMLRDTAKLGAILDKVVSLGANQINSIQFDVAEPETLKDEARKLALNDAESKAKLYADAAGVTLGPIQSIAEEESVHQPRFASPAAARMEAADVPIEAGTASVQVRVRVTWELN